MGLRPKTARRLALIGALTGMVVIGGVALLTVPKWQRARQIESFKRNGLQAHQDGEHHEAVRMLNRHTSAVGEERVEPIVLLSLARSQAEAEARRDNHYNVAISRYLAYLRLEPDDLDARRELLGVYVDAQRWGEAVDLAERINSFDRVSDDEELEAIRDEWIARRALDDADERLPVLEEMLLSVDPPAFQDAWAVFRAYATPEYLYESFEAMRRYAAARPDSPGARFVEFIEPPSPELSLSQKEIIERAEAGIEALQVYLGLDGDARTPGSVQLEERELAQAISGTFDSFSLPLLSAEVLSQALVGEQADENRNHLARRLYWLGEDEALDAIGLPDDRLDRVIDTLGYQALGALRSGETERADALEREIATVDFSYKAKSWLDALAAYRALESGDLPAARVAAKNAVERYETEPTFRLIYGDAHGAMGFVSEALTQWSAATAAAGSVPWADPILRRVLALIEDDQQLEARRLMQETLGTQRFARLLPLRLLSLRIDSALFMRGLISPDEAMAVALQGERLQILVAGAGGDQFDLSDIDLSLARIYGRLGEQEEAVRVLSRVLSSQYADVHAAEVRQIDERFGLGLAQAQGQRPLPETVGDPLNAQQIAVVYCEAALYGNISDQSEDAFETRVDESIAWLEAGTDRSGEDERPAWLLAQARFIEAVRPEQATPYWRAAVDADPENLDVLREVVWAQELGKDPVFVEAQIDRIRELTLSQGRTLPANLRLARARAIFGDRPSRAQRDQALGIVRSVVAAEPGNVRARNTLGNLLATPVHPSYTGEDRFEPDLEGAIEQFQTIAAGIPGYGAVPYYIRIMELANEIGDEERAMRAVRDVLQVAESDVNTVRQIAISMRRAGEAETAARVLENFFNMSDGSDRLLAGLVLAETFTILRRDGDAGRVLSQLAQSEGFNAEQLTSLAIRLRQNGLTEDVESLLASAERGGMDRRVIDTVRAELLAGFVPFEEALEGLDAITNNDPENVEAWQVLIRLLIERDELDLATPRIADALAANPGDRSLELLEAQAVGDTDLLARRTRADLGNRRDSQLALEAIESFEQRRGSMTPEAQIAELTSLTERFSRLGAAVNYTLVERDALGEDMSTLIADATAAARLFPEETTVLRIATKACLAMGEYDAAAQFALGWRAVADGSRQEPDLYAAEAFQGLGLDDRAMELTEPYVAEAIQNAGEPLNQAVLTLHGASAMRSGRASEIRVAYGPPAAADPDFRVAVWVRLASRWSDDAGMAFEWLDAAEQWGTAGIEVPLAEAWAEAARRFEPRRVEMLRRGLAVVENGVQRSPNDLRALVTQAGLLRALGLVDEEDSGDWNTRAEMAYVRADAASPENLNFLFQAARAAEDDGRHADAERHYRALLTRPNCTGDFAAGVNNNAAMSIVRQLERDPQRLSEALGMVGSALSTREIPEFYNTRGWVRYLSGDTDGAAEDFRTRVQRDAANAIAWAGIALAERGADPEPSEGALAAWERATQFGLDEQFVLELADTAGFSSE